jgi:hypothetical protein
VQLIDETDNVLASQQLTTTLAPNASAVADLTYTPAPAGNKTIRGKVVIDGDGQPANDFTSPTTYKVYPIKPIANCTNGNLTGMGTNSANTLSAAIQYTTNTINYTGLNLTAIELGLCEDPSMLSNCTVWARTS